MLIYEQKMPYTRIDTFMDRLNIKQKISEKRLTVLDLKHFTERYYCDIISLIGRNSRLFNENSDLEDILKGVYVIRIKNLFQILEYIVPAKLNSNRIETNIDDIDNISYFSKLPGSLHYRKERLNLFICKVGRAVTENKLSETANEIWHSLGYTLNLIHLLVHYYVDPSLDPQIVRLMTFLGEFKIVYSDNVLSGNFILAIQDFNHRYIYANGSEVGIKTEIKEIDIYPRPWDPIDTSYDPNHYFAGLCNQDDLENTFNSLHV